MNFVDAIRLASQNAVALQAATTPAATPGNETQPMEAAEAAASPAPAQPAPQNVTTPQPALPPQTPPRENTDQEVVTQLLQEPSGGSVVRIELRLSPEQTQILLNSALTSNHRYLTSREAAKYLRMTKSAVEEMAENNELPAFQLEGTWRFEKNSLDDWATRRIAKPEGNQGSAA